MFGLILDILDWIPFKAFLAQLVSLVDNHTIGNINVWLCTGTSRTLVGHVFQGRYKAILVEKESYLLELAR